MQCPESTLIGEYDEEYALGPASRKSIHDLSTDSSHTSYRAHESSNSYGRGVVDTYESVINSGPTDLQRAET